MIGPSGCGKSTLLSLIAGLLEPGRRRDHGRRRRSPADRLARCALMPQRDLLLPWRSRARQRRRWRSRTPGSAAARHARQAAPLFERFGLAEFEPTRPPELSGGMRQRVAFLRTLLAGKPVLLLDEPFGALDAITRLELQDWLVEALEAEPRTVVLVTHDVDEALKLCPRVVALSHAARPGVVLDAASSDVDPRRRPGGAAVVKKAGWVAVLILLVVAWQAYVEPARRSPGTCCPRPPRCCARSGTTARPWSRSPG